MQQKKVLYIIIYFLLYGSVIQKYVISNTIIASIPDILVIYLFFFNNKSNNRIATAYKSVIPTTLVGCFFALGTISALINLSSLLTTLWGIRMFLRYFLLSYLVFSSFGKKDIKKCKKILYTSFNINIVFCLVDRFSGRTNDFLGGIMFGNSDLAVYLVVCTLLFSLDFFSKLLDFKKFVFYTIVAIIIAMWAEMRFLYYVIPLCIYGAYVFTKGLNVKNIIILAVSFFLVVPLLKWTLSFYYGDNYIENSFNTEFIQKYTSSEVSYGFTDKSINRGTVLESTHVFYLKKPLNAAIGHGLGSGSISSFFKGSQSNTALLTNYYYFTSSYVLLETGWIGYILFLSIYFVITYRFYKLYKKATNYRVKYWSGYGMLLGAFTFLLIWYNACPYSIYYIPFLMWGICLVALKKI